MPGAVIKAGLVPVAMPSASSLDDIAPVTTALQAWHIERKGKEAKEARCAICARSGVRTIVEVLAEHGGSLDLVTACIDVLTTLGLDASLKRTATAQLPVLLGLLNVWGAKPGPSGLVWENGAKQALIVVSLFELFARLCAHDADFKARFISADGVAVTLQVGGERERRNREVASVMFLCLLMSNLPLYRTFIWQVIDDCPSVAGCGQSLATQLALAVLGTVRAAVLPSSAPLGGRTLEQDDHDAAVAAAALGNFFKSRGLVRVAALQVRSLLYLCTFLHPTSHSCGVRYIHTSSTSSPSQPHITQAVFRENEAVRDAADLVLKHKAVGGVGYDKLVAKKGGSGKSSAAGKRGTRKEPRKKKGLFSLGRKKK